MQPTQCATSADLKAGEAVALGALLAGPLFKRSEWLHSWNKRFCTLSTEELAWLPADRAGEWRSVTLLSTVRLLVRESTLVLQPAGTSAHQYCFRAASEPELRMWHAQIRAILEGIQAEGRVARLHMRESCALFAAPFVEVPHIGSRNHRERGLQKLFYLCCQRPDEAQLSSQHTTGEAAGSPDVCMYLLALPDGAARWSGVQVRRAGRSPRARRFRGASLARPPPSALLCKHARTRWHAPPLRAHLHTTAPPPSPWDSPSPTTTSLFSLPFCASVPRAPQPHVRVTPLGSHATPCNPM